MSGSMDVVSPDLVTRLRVAADLEGPDCEDLVMAADMIDRLRSAADGVCFHWFECERGDCGHLGDSMDHLKVVSGYDGAVGDLPAPEMRDVPKGPS